MKNLDLGEVFWGVLPVSFVRRLEVSNPYTEYDTLILKDYENNYLNSELHISGPFTGGVLDTVLDMPFMNHISYKITPSYEVRYKFKGEANWRKALIPITNFCTDELYEAVIKIDW